MNPDHLTTLPNHSLELVELFKLFDGSEILLIAETIIEPIGSRIGLLEERGAWVQSFWSDVIDSLDYVHGCRFYWDSMIFCCDINYFESFVNIYSDILKRQSYEKLVSKTVIGYPSGKSLDEKRNTMYQVDEITRYIDRDVAVYDFEKSVNLFKFINGINVT